MATTQSVENLMFSISKNEYFLPEFQRGFVWNSDQVKKYIQSLYYSYPTGSFLIWKSENPSKIKGNITEDGSFKMLILDGQQRLTTLYAMIKGTLPPWLEGKSIRTDLFFNLETEEFQYYSKTLMEGKREWINVSDFCQKRIGNFIDGADDASKSYYIAYFKKLNQLDAIHKYQYYIQEIFEQDTEKVVQIFNLVNSEGTPLSQSDLSLALVTTRWEECKDKMRNTIDKYRKFVFLFDMNFFMRGIAVIGTSRAKFDDIKQLSETDLIETWSKLEKTLDYLCNVMIHHAYIDDTSFLSSLTPFHPLLYYIAKNEFKFPDPQTRDKLLYWLYSSLLWGRYSGASETDLEKDIRILKETNSGEELIKSLALSRGGNLNVTEQDLQLQGVRSRVYQIFYILIRSNGAADWADTSLPLYHKGVGKTYAIERHHIFPKSKLYKTYDSNSSYNQRLINELANIALVTSGTNHDILNDSPENYLPQVDSGQLRKQYVPLDASLWKLSKDGYEAFLKERRRLLAEAINQFLHRLYHGEASIHVVKDLSQWRDRVEGVERAIRKLIIEVYVINEDDIDPKSFVPQHIEQKVEIRVKKHLSDNPAETKSTFDVIEKRIDFFDISEYFDLISSKDNWQYFEPIFGQKPMLQSRFSQLQNIRNAVAHSRELNDVMVKDGEAAILWFSSALRKYMTECVC